MYLINFESKLARHQKLFTGCYIKRKYVKTYLATNRKNARLFANWD